MKNEIINSERPKINIDDLKEIIKNLVIKLDEPVFIVGRFGGGKSQGIQQACRELNEPGALDALLGVGHGFKGVICHDAVRLRSYGPVDLRGTPWPDKASMLTHWFAPATFPWEGNDAFPDDYLILLFMDEATSAEEDVLAVLYQIVLDRASGEHKLKKNVRICLAGNLDDDHGVVNEIPMPLNNRCTHFELVLDVEKLVVHYQSIGAPPIFIAFLMFCKDLANTYDPKAPTPIVATPRTIEKAIKYYKTDMPEDLKRMAMEGVVGRGWTTQFMGFHDVWRNVIPIKKIIADPEGVPLPQGEDALSMLYATVVNVAGAMTLKNAAPLYKFLCRFEAMFAVLGMTLATTRDNSLYGTPEFLHFTKRYRDVYSR